MGASYVREVDGQLDAPIREVNDRGLSNSTTSGSTAEPDRKRRRLHVPTVLDSPEIVVRSNRTSQLLQDTGSIVKDLLEALAADIADNSGTRCEGVFNSLCTRVRQITPTSRDFGVLAVLVCIGERVEVDLVKSNPLLRVKYDDTGGITQDLFDITFPNLLDIPNDEAVDVFAIYSEAVKVLGSDTPSVLVPGTDAASKHRWLSSCLFSILRSGMFCEKMTEHFSNQEALQSLMLKHLQIAGQDLCFICQESLRESPVAVPSCGHALHESCFAEVCTRHTRQDQQDSVGKCRLCKSDYNWSFLAEQSLVNLCVNLVLNAFFAEESSGEMSDEQVEEDAINFARVLWDLPVTVNGEHATSRPEDLWESACAIYDECSDSYKGVMDTRFRQKVQELVDEDEFEEGEDEDDDDSENDEEEGDDEEEEDNEANRCRSTTTRRASI